MKTHGRTGHKPAATAGQDACPCGSAQPYAQCCGLVHAGGVAITAEALMRSRYSAYVLGDADYLLRTWHPDTRPDRLEIEPAVRWLGLEVRAAQATGEQAATVEFIARCRHGGAAAVRLHEVSRFVREEGCWYYLDGAFPSG